MAVRSARFWAGRLLLRVSLYYIISDTKWSRSYGSRAYRRRIAMPSRPNAWRTRRPARPIADAVFGLAFILPHYCPLWSLYHTSLHGSRNAVSPRFPLPHSPRPAFLAPPAKHTLRYASPPTRPSHTVFEYAEFDRALPESIEAIFYIAGDQHCWDTRPQDWLSHATALKCEGYARWVH